MGAEGTGVDEVVGGGWGMRLDGTEGKESGQGGTGGTGGKVKNTVGEDVTGRTGWDRKDRVEQDGR